MTDLNPDQFPVMDESRTIRDQGRIGERTHLTLKQYGTVPIHMVRNMVGARGELPGEHRNMQGERWESFKNDIAQRGIEHGLFITVDYGERPKLSEGNHRRDAAVELGMTHVPVEINYYGHAEQQGTIGERFQH